MASANSIRRVGVAMVLVAALACVYGVAQARPPQQARFRQPNAEYHARREKLRAMVDGPIVLYGYTGHEDASEVALFFQEQNFYYLTGHDEPGAVVILVQGLPAAEHEETLYLPPRDPKEEIWEGPKIGPDDPGVQL